VTVYDNIAQGSPEWLALRKGRATASRFSDIITAQTGQLSSSARGYMRELIGECFCPDFEYWSGNYATERGKELEAEAREAFAIETGLAVEQVAFCLSANGITGCSPDGLIGTDGGIEVKCPSIPIHARYLLDGELPKDYVIQVHFSMYVTNRPWWLFLSYNRQFPALLLKVERDPKADAAIEHALELFAEDFDAKCKRLRDLRAAGAILRRLSERCDKIATDSR
jgi:hypothetical protein